MTRAAAWLVCWVSLCLQAFGLWLLDVAKWCDAEQTAKTYTKALRGALERHGTTADEAADELGDAMRTHLGTDNAGGEVKAARERAFRLARCLAAELAQAELGACTGSHGMAGPAEVSMPWELYERLCDVQIAMREAHELAAHSEPHPS